MKTKALGIFLRTAIIAAPIVWACLGPAHAQGYEFEWIVTGGGPDRDVIEEIAVDSAGELFAIGTYSRRMEIEGETVERPDADAPGAGLKNSLFVVKLDRSADVTWLLSPTRAGLSYGDDVKISSDGVVWIGAQYSDDIALGGRIIRADPPGSSLIARLSAADGSVLGLERLPSSYNALAPAPDGGMYNYSLPTTASPADETARLRRLRRTGAEQWSADRIAPYQPYNIFADQDGNALLNVETSGVLARITGVDTITLDDRTVRVLDVPNQSLIIRVTPAGRWEYVVESGSRSNEINVNQIATASDGDLLMVAHGFWRLSGLPATTTMFGEDATLSYGRSYGVIAKIDRRSGAADWVEILEFGPSPDGGLDNGLFPGIAPFGRGAVIALHGPPLAPGAPTTPGSYLAKVGPEGFSGYRRLGGSDIIVRRMAGVDLRRFYVAGTFSETATINGHTLVSNGAQDFWIGMVRAVDPLPDACETYPASCVTAWAHRHWICRNPENRFGGRTGCAQIFDNRTLVPREAADIFSIQINNLTLNNATDIDRFTITLPDPQDARWGDYHADVHPDPAADTPLEECGAVIRSGGTIGEARPDIPRADERVHTRGTLSVTVIPAVGSADGPVSLAGETVILRRLDGTLIGDTTAPGKAIIRCPLSDLPLERGDVSFGERAGPRSLVDVGAYSLLVEYRIDAERGLPDWVLAETDRRYLGPLLCPRGFSGPRFPLCTGIVPRFDVVHPGRDFLDCIADGPGCFSLHRFDLAWPLRFDLDLTVTQPVQISLLDVEGATLAQNVIDAPIDHKQLSRATLAAPKMLETGTYFLKVEGPPSRISVSLPLDQRADSVTPLPKRPWRLIIIVAFVLVALLAFVVIWQRVRRKSG